MCQGVFFSGKLFLKQAVHGILKDKDKYQGVKKFEVLNFIF